LQQGGIAICLGLDHGQDFRLARDRSMGKPSWLVCAPGISGAPSRAPRSAPGLSWPFSAIVTCPNVSKKGAFTSSTGWIWWSFKFWTVAMGIWRIHLLPPLGKNPPRSKLSPCLVGFGHAWTSAARACRPSPVDFT
jgi:hypothetical protein